MMVIEKAVLMDPPSLTHVPPPADLVTVVLDL
jgi:hypothetical protein